MRLGIDLGTTRTVVAVCDRGNYPIVGFSAPDGDVIDHVPTTTAEVDERLLHGHAAEQAARQGAPVLRSWKRLLGAGATADQPVRIGAVTLSLLELTTDFLVALHDSLHTDANLPGDLEPRPEVVVSVPANAHSTQRFVTLESFRRAGFSVVAMINEPSAAGLEYAHRYARTITSRREHVIVYDLGGGTFDAALVRIADGHHDVLLSSGVNRLGGDDFDAALLDLALERLGHPGTLSESVRGKLMLACRHAKESIHPNTRRVVVDLEALGADAPAEPLVVEVADLYERVRPLIDQTVAALEPVLARAADQESLEAGMAEGVAGLYVVGGGSGLPAVPRVLREDFGRRVHRSAYPSAATAIGLAIAAEAADRPPVSERLARHFGVFRERDAGREVSFDPIFVEGTPMPAPGELPLTAVRVYRAAHNIGHFRFVECGRLDKRGQPCGDITPHASVHFPFLTDTLNGTPVEELPISRLPALGPRIEERFEVDAAGVIAVTLRNLDSGHERRFVL